MGKEIDIHQDYVLYNLMGIVGRTVHTVIAYMQKTTPYGDKYIKAFEKGKEVEALLEEFESALQECVEAKEGKSQ